MNLDNLEEIARAATQGEWRVRASELREVVAPDGTAVAWCGIFPVAAAYANTSHIAAFDPPTVLAMLARLKLQEAVCRAAEGLMLAPEIGGSMQTVGLRASLEALRALEVKT